MGLKIFVMAVFVFVLPFFVSAQTTPPPDLIPTAPFTAAPQPPQGTVNCFDYYKFGSVSINDLNVSAPNPVSGIPLGITGTVQNANPYPIIDGAVYIKVFREDEHFSRSQSYGIVDQFIAQENITLPANGTAQLSAVWNIPSYLATGDYRIASFFVSQGRYNLLGLSFTDDIVGNVVSFHVNGERAQMVRIDKGAVTINQKPHFFVGPYPSFDKDEKVTITVPIVNETTEQTSTTVSWTLSEWDGMRTEAILNEKTETLALTPKEKKSVSYEVSDTRFPVYYLTVRTKTGDVSSVANIRFTREGAITPRINFPSVLSYPLKAGEEATLFSCLHATGYENVENGALELTLSDEQGDTLRSYRYQGVITGAMMGVKDSFVPKKDYYDFSLTAKMYKDGMLIDETTTRYDCNALNPNNPEVCPKETGSFVVNESAGVRQNLVQNALLATVFLGIIAFLTIVVQRIYKKRQGN